MGDVHVSSKARSIVPRSPAFIGRKLTWCFSSRSLPDCASRACPMAHSIRSSHAQQRNRTPVELELTSLTTVDGMSTTSTNSATVRALQFAATASETTLRRYRHYQSKRQYTEALPEVLSHQSTLDFQLGCHHTRTRRARIARCIDRKRSLCLGAPREKMITGPSKPQSRSCIPQFAGATSEWRLSASLVAPII